MDTYSASWFGNRCSTGSTCLNVISRFVVATGLCVSLGTGVFSDDLTRLRQEQKHKQIMSHPVRVRSIEPIIERTPAEDIEQIRNVLSPAISDLAKSFNVSRQTIYNWLNGEQPTPEHTSRLRELGLVADMFDEAGIPVNGVLLKRKVIKGKSLLELIAEGGSAYDTGQLFLQILQNEQSQRDRLVARLADRRTSPYSNTQADDEA